MSNTLYACGQLGITPPADWLQRYWDASAATWGEFKPQGLSSTMHALGQLGITPPAAWLQGYWDASGLKLSEFNPQDFSKALRACWKLGITPPVDWLRCVTPHASPLTKRSPSKPTTEQFQLNEDIQACVSVEAVLDLAMVRPALLNGVNVPTALMSIAKLGEKGEHAQWLEKDARFQQLLAAAVLLMARSEVDEHGLANLLYACGQLGVVPSSTWFATFWATSSLALGDFVPQGLSNVMYACGQLGITPPGTWLQRFWLASAKQLDELSSQGLSNVLRACAQLDVRPPSSWLLRFSDSFEHSMTRATRQDLANTALSLATLALWELPLWSSLWERLLHAVPRDPSEWNAEMQLAAHQLYQSYQTAAIERPGLLSATDPELLAAARKSWMHGMTGRSSRLHTEVSECLTRMGVTHANEQWCERAERSIDIAIEGAGAPIALEVDGPHHFLQDGRQDGSTRLRNRMLAAHGWRVTVVDYRVWQQLKTQAQREEYMRSLLG